MVRSCDGECEWKSVVVETIRMGVEVEERADRQTTIGLLLNTCLVWFIQKLI